MAVTLSTVERPDAVGSPLEEVERIKVNDRVLAVAKRASGELVLAREITRAVKGADGKASKDRESVLKATAALADIADAFASGLLVQ